ncbi:hypothetical protein BTR23_08160 [Alkalihalophilus pseudofirmus]|uniref:DUF2524 family protein n=1 Tax=Alkalihalobacterium alkalinitrilicum TaxID=427920 RepID=UPI00094CCE6E|nr:DUF2524 family protein [Alkalihalobacterium alkalinitrilicum]OLO40448.1 hypothetical protein BTR23_08160 [Alkalihalophilus pseudofirmus]
MVTNNELEHFLNKVQSVVDQGLDELLETKMIRENDPSDYSYIQFQLHELVEESDQLMKKFPDQHEQLSDVQQKIKEIQEVMVKGIF